MEKCLSNQQVMVDAEKQQGNKEVSTVKERNSEPLLIPKLTSNKEQTTPENDNRKPLAERVRPILIDEMQVFFCRTPLLCREMMNYSTLEVLFVTCWNEILHCLLFSQDPQGVVKRQ